MGVLCASMHVGLSLFFSTSLQFIYYTQRRTLFTASTSLCKHSLMYPDTKRLLILYARHDSAELGGARLAAMVVGRNHQQALYNILHPSIHYDSLLLTVLDSILHPSIHYDSLLLTVLDNILHPSIHYDSLLLTVLYRQYMTLYIL